MGIQVEFGPPTVSCGIVEPGAKGTGTAACGQLSTPASVTASITSDSSGGRLKVSAVRSYVTSVQTVSALPGEGPVGTYKESVTQQVGKSNGIKPLAVLAGQWVEVDVQFAPTASTADFTTATLEIVGDIWDPVSLPVTAQVGKLKLDVPTEITLVQNHSTKVKVTVTSKAGPKTTAKLILGSTSPSPPVQVTLHPNDKVTLDKGKSESRWLRASAGLTVAPGKYPFDLSLWAFDNQYSFTVGAPTVKVKKLKLRSSPIPKKYKQPGMAKLLGKRVGHEDFCGDWVGQYQQYKKGVIYWSGKKNAKAFEIHGEILSALLAGAGRGSPDLPTDVSWYLSDLVLGNYPSTDVLHFPDGGQASHFHGSGLFWKSNLGASWVENPAFDAYDKLGGPKGALGFPLGTNTVYAPNGSTDFENGALGGLNGATRLLAFDRKNAPGNIFGQANAFDAATVLKVVREGIKKVIKHYNAANPSGPRIEIPKGEEASFLSPMLTDYSFLGTNLLPRMYRIQQKLIVWVLAFDPVPVSFTFDLALVAGGPTSGGTDITGKPVKGKSPASVQPAIYNVAVAVDTSGQIYFPKSAAQQLHDAILKAVTSAALPTVPIAVPPTSVKVLTTGEGVGLTAKTAPGFDVKGAVVVLFGL